MTRRTVAFLSLLALAACSADDGIEGATQSESASAPDDPAITADEVSVLDADELEALFLGGRAPAPAELVGELRGRVLTVDKLDDGDLVLQGIRNILDASHYEPWLHKTFAATGVGENAYIPFDHEFRTASFVYGTGPSRADGEPALLLDYARHDNLFLLWGVKEELRAVGRGVYLGRSYFETGGGRAALFYFVLTRS